MTKLHNHGAEAFCRVFSGKEAYMPLLLEADPSADMIRGYLDDGELYTLTVRSSCVAVAVVTDLGGGAFELKNLAVAEARRGQGYGGSMVRYLMKQLIGRADRLVVGTSPANVGFYERLGFVREGAIPHFFRENYPEPIIEDGVVLDDMILLAARL